MQGYLCRRDSPSWLGEESEWEARGSCYGKAVAVQEPSSSRTRGRVHDFHAMVFHLLSFDQERGLACRRRP